jgi:hypothetical protein
MATEPVLAPFELAVLYRNNSLWSNRVNQALGEFRLTGQDTFRVADEPRLSPRYHSEQNGLTDGVGSWLLRLCDPAQKNPSAT